MAWVNEELARNFAEIAALLRIKGADRFRVRAYERASDAIATAKVDLAGLDLAALKALKGIGEATAEKITEYFATGSIGMLEELREKVPPALIELTRVPGLGPKTALTIHKELGIDSVASLTKAIEEGRLVGIPGLGEKTVENLREALQRMGTKDVNRFPASLVLSMAREIVERMESLEDVERAAYAGSLRRMRETIGDIDVLVASAADPAPIHEAFRSMSMVTRILAAGDKKSSVLTVRGVQADLRVVEPVAWGAALQYFTGSKTHNVRIRERAVRMGYLLNEYGLFHRTEDGEQGERIASETEEGVYAAIGLQWIPPPMREDQGEVDAAANGTLPNVVTVEDMLGDLHGHSDWSGDGRVPIAGMIQAAQARGYEYWGVTDHAEDLTINGLSREQVRGRRVEIRALQEQFPDIAILDGSELNIGMRGELDYDADFLLEYEWTVASVHSALRREEPFQTARIMRAIESPAVNCIGHLTGRKIGRRPGFEVDLAAILEACRETGTALEVNASPARLDLSGEMVRRGVEAGVTLTISTDAHYLPELDNMRYGVSTAQRGWATAADVLNTRPLAELRAFVAAKREKFS